MPNSNSNSNSKRYELYLTSLDKANFVNTIITLRRVNGDLGLKEAKDFADAVRYNTGARVRVLQGSRAKVRAAKKELAKVGAGSIIRDSF